MIFIFFDIHSHILPAVDDGAKSTEKAIEILKLMKNSGITDVIATPHFYPNIDSLNYYLSVSNTAYKNLKNDIKDMRLPNIYRGTEVLYYRHIGESESVKYFCLNNSPYLLLELTNNCIGNELFNDIKALKEKQGITVIIAHIERYYKSRNYKKLLKFVKEEDILTQINASSFFTHRLSNAAKKLIKNGYATFIATDAHSPDDRPPMLKEALNFINDKLGSEYSEKLIKNSQSLFNEIIGRR